MVERLIISRQQMQFATGRAQALAAIAQASEERRFPANVVVADIGEEASGGVIRRTLDDGVPPSRRTFETMTTPTTRSA